MSSGPRASRALMTHERVARSNLRAETLAVRKSMKRRDMSRSPRSGKTLHWNVVESDIKAIHRRFEGLSLWWWKQPLPLTGAHLCAPDNLSSYEL
jgi:hypothetical protein